ncbi:CASP8 and FADD-like apoptosis regulator [Pristimantis euphronides]
MSSLHPSSRTLVQIYEELEPDEEEVIRFACRDINVTTNVSLLLSELNEKHSQPVILELLHLLKRFDLIKKHYKLPKAEVETFMKKQSRVVSDYRYLIIELNEQVEEHDLKSLIFILKDDLRNIVKIKNKTFLSLIVELEKNQLLTPSNLDFLKDLFGNIHRVDLKKRILKFQQKDYVSRGGPCINAYPVPASLYRNGGSTSSSTTLTLQGCLYIYLQIENHDERYLVRKETMGFCVIIDCVGNDSEMLQVLFRSLHFVVQCHLYKKVGDVEEILQDIAKMEQHRNHDIFACVVISRGNADSLFCLDGNLPGLSLEKIRNIFTGKSCPNLRGKPKLFFIQNYFVCDVEELQEEGSVEVDGLREDAASCLRVQNQTKIPNEADIFWSHCRVDELELQRSSGSTSLYLRSLRDLLSNHKIRKHRDLLDIQTELNRIIYTKQAGYSLQLKHTLTKKLFIYPV